MCRHTPHISLYLKKKYTEFWVPEDNGSYLNLNLSREILQNKTHKNKEKKIKSSSAQPTDKETKKTRSFELRVNPTHSSRAHLTGEMSHKAWKREGKVMDRRQTKSLPQKESPTLSGKILKTDQILGN